MAITTERETRVCKLMFSFCVRRNVEQEFKRGQKTPLGQRLGGEHFIPMTKEFNQVIN